MRSIPATKTLTVLSLLAALGAGTAHVNAQDGAEEEKKGLPSLSEMRGKVKTGETPIPSPFDAFLALEMISSKGKPVDWKDVLNSGVAAIDPADYNGTVPVSLMLGVKISDGLIAIKSKDPAALNEVATAIESLAKKINVGGDQLKRAESVRKLASDDDWLGVFLELGYLQEDIIQSLEDSSRKEQRALILAAGWTQGARFAAYAIDKNYTPEASNILREPDLISRLIADLQATEAAKSSDVVKKMLEEMPTIQQTVNIGRDGTIPQEKVAEIQKKCAALVAQIEATK
jgi:hypothetical protein